MRKKLKGVSEKWRKWRSRFGNYETHYPGEAPAAIAELPNVPTAAAIANAVADAVGVRIFHLPITAEKVYWALQRKR